MSIQTDADFIAESATRVATHLKLVDRHGDTVLSRLQDSMNGHPKAACWDNGPKSDEPSSAGSAPVDTDDGGCEDTPLADGHEGEAGGTGHPAGPPTAAARAALRKVKP